MGRITCFPDPITSLWWQTAGAHRETAKLDTAMENKARAFNVVLCKLGTLKMSGSSLHTEKQKGETNVWMFILYMKLWVITTRSSEKAHTLLSAQLCVSILILSTMWHQPKGKKNKTKQQNPHISTPGQSHQRFKVLYNITNIQMSNLWKSNNLNTFTKKKKVFFW